MATVNLLLKSKNNPAQIYVRFSNTRALDFICSSGILINPIFWNSKNQQIRNIIDVTNRDEINSKLAKLKITLIDDFNLSFMKGEIINKVWLEQRIKLFFNRPKFEDKKNNLNHHIFLSDFADNWLEFHAKNWKVSANKYMDDTTIRHYRILKNLIVKFEKKNKIKLVNLDSKIIDGFSVFLSQNGYAEQTAKRMVGRLKFFGNRAEEMNIEINKNFKQQVFVQKQEQFYKSPYLNEDEINQIFKYDFSHNDTLDNVRDNFIIGLWTGLRVSDFLVSLNLSNIKNGFLEIKTQKTGTNVVIPIHDQVQHILNKRAGFLPTKISEPKFNIYIKKICQILNFDDVILGGIAKVDPETKLKRKVIGNYKKYELITSHICRRSFCTNLFGKIPNADIMAIAGWSSEGQMLAYNKKTNMESAIKLKKHWENKY